MGIQVGMGFDLKSPQYLDSRQSFETLEEMHACDKNIIPEGFITFNKEDGVYYNLKKNDSGVLEWEEFSSGSGGGGGGNNTAPMVTIDKDIKKIYALSDEIEIPYFVVDAEGGKMKATYYIGDEIVSEQTVSLASKNIWKIGKLQKGSYSLMIKVTDQFGLSGVDHLNISVGQLEISSSFNIPPRDYTIDSPISIFYNVDLESFENVKAYYTLDGEGLPPVNITKKSNEWLVGNLHQGPHNLKIQLTKDSVYSNILEYDIAVLDSEGLYITSDFKLTEATIEDRITIFYRLSTQLKETKFRTFVQIDDQEVKILDSYKGSNQWNIGYLPIGNHVLKLYTKLYQDDSIQSNTLTFNLQINEASEELEPSVMESLVCWFDARDNSNDSNEKHLWKDRSRNNTKAYLKNMNFTSNGWINEELTFNGESYCEIDLKPFEYSITDGLTIDIQYRMRNVGDIEGRIISCEMSDSPHNGIYINTESAVINGDGIGVSLPVIENELCRTTFVIDRTLGLVLIYHNAVISNIIKISPTIDFIHDGKIYLNARMRKDGNLDHFGNCNIRNLRVYSRNLTYHEVLQNHISDMKLVDQKKYKAKNYPKPNEGLPKCTIIGDLTPIMNAESTKVEVFREVIFENNSNMDVTPFTEAEVSIKPQGTSSLSYPVKNFKFKLKGPDGKGRIIHKDWKKMKTYCLKADFMDSTHANNLASARFIPSLYENPLHDDLGNEVRSTIDGFPILVFNKLTPDSEEKYIGVYCWNLDKGGGQVMYGLRDDAPGHLMYVGDMNDITGNGPVGFWETDDDELIGQHWESEFAGYDESVKDNFNEDGDKVLHPELKRLIKWVSTCAKMENKFEAKKKFTSELDQYWDKDYLIDYYLCCMMLGMVDSLGKNMRLVTYDGLKWYATFYDMDSILGLDNSGARKYEPDVEFSQYNTSTSALWKCVKEYLKDDVNKRYTYLRVDNKKFSMEHIFKYWNGDVMDKIGEVFFNRETYEKYLPFGEAHLEKVHGHRQGDLKRWVSERLIFMDSLFEVGPEFGKPITMRLKPSKDPQPGEILEEYATIFLRAYSNQYVKVQFGINTPDYTIKKLNKKDLIPITGKIKSNDLDVMISSASQLMNIDGLNTLSLEHLKIERASRLIDLDVSNNKKLQQLALDVADGSITDSRYLQSLKLRNCTGMAADSQLNLTRCFNLKELDASGSTIPLVDFCEGGSLKTINLSSTQIAKFVINNHEYLEYINLLNCPRLSTFSIKKCNKIKSIDLPSSTVSSINIEECNSIERIDLSGCYRLTNIKIPYLPNLREINISNASTSITELDLSSCPNIEKIIASNCAGLTQIKLNANCKSLKYLDVSRSSIRDLLIGNESIGNGINLKPFTMEFVSFDSCSEVIQIKNINLSNMKNSNNLFSNCRNLTSITGNITLNGSCTDTFYNCLSLVELPTININSNVISLYRTFANCSAITMEHVINIFSNAINVQTANETFIGCSNIVGQLPDNLFENCLELKYLNYTFSGCKISGSLPSTLISNLTKLETMNFTFNYNEGITGTLPSTFFNNNRLLTTLEGTFVGCGLNGQIPNQLFKNNPKITTMKNLFAGNKFTGSIPSDLFSYCPDLTNIEMILANNNGLTGNIPSTLFSNNSKLTNISNALQNCDKIGENMPIPSNLFVGCTALTNVTGFFKNKLFNGTIPANLFNDTTELINTTSLFEGCTNLTGQIPATLFSNCSKINIISSIFKNCSSITSIAPTLINPFKARLQYADNAFYGCNGLIGNLPNSLFENCVELLDASYLFAECRDIISDIPRGLFNGCESVVNLNGLFFKCLKLRGEIPSDIFDSCISLQSISSVFADCESIGNNVALPNLFKNNRELQYIDSAFSNCKKIGTKGENNINDIPSDIFANCKKIRSASGLFNGCESLSGEIPYLMFEDCDKLTNISSLFSSCSRISGDIPRYMFRNCTSINAMGSTFLNCSNLTLLPPELFESCKSTTNKNVSALFKNCSKLTGEPIKLWEGYNVTTSSECYKGCTSLSNTSSIPPTYL